MLDGRVGRGRYGAPVRGRRLQSGRVGSAWGVRAVGARVLRGRLPDHPPPPCQPRRLGPYGGGRSIGGGGPRYGCPVRGRSPRSGVAADELLGRLRERTVHRGDPVPFGVAAVEVVVGAVGRSVVLRLAGVLQGVSDESRVRLPARGTRCARRADEHRLPSLHGRPVPRAPGALATLRTRGTAATEVGRVRSSPGRSVGAGRGGGPS